MPCVEKRWLETGGFFFTTAPFPSAWDSPDARALQQAAKEHLGADAFFDMESVLRNLDAMEPIPAGMRPEELQPPRRLPNYPFRIEPVVYRSIEEELTDARSHFEGQGYQLECTEGTTLLFRDQRGDLLRVTVGPGGSVERIQQT